MAKHKVSGALLGIVLAALSLPAYAQSVVLEENTTDTVVERVGPNRAHYIHTFFSFGFMAGNPESGRSAINYGSSLHYDFGMRYKLKILRHWAIGSGLDFGINTYNIRQRTQKIIPDSITHASGRLTRYMLNMELYNRVNFGRRGNYIGTFLDLGAYGGLGFAATYFTRDKLPGGEIIRSRMSRVKYLEPLEYGLLARFGINRWVVFCRYRMSEMFKSSYDLPEMPRFIAGFQIGFHK